jgi:hypothetical protein
MAFSGAFIVHSSLDVVSSSFMQGEGSMERFMAGSNVSASKDLKKLTKKKQHSQNRLLVYLSSLTLSLTIGQAKS